MAGEDMKASTAVSPLSAQGLLTQFLVLHMAERQVCLFVFSVCLSASLSNDIPLASYRFRLGSQLLFLLVL